MSISLNRLIALLPIAFAVHNAEEVLSVTLFDYPAPSIISVTSTQFAVAAGLFSVVGFSVVYAKRFYKSREQYINWITGFAGLIFLNALFHLFSVVYFQKYLPGFITALTINIPLSLVALRKVQRTEAKTRKDMLTAIFIGGSIGLILAAAFLGLAKLY